MKKMITSEITYLDRFEERLAEIKQESTSDPYTYVLRPHDDNNDMVQIDVFWNYPTAVICYQGACAMHLKLDRSVALVRGGVILAIQRSLDSGI